MPTQFEQHALAACPDCHYPLRGQQIAHTRQVLDLPPPAPLVVTEHQFLRRWCPHCQQWCVPPSALPEHVLGQGRIGARLASLIVYLHSALRLPIRAIQTYLQTLHQCRLSTGGIVELLHRVRRTTLAAELCAAAWASPHAHMDETGWRENGQNGYIWELATGGTAPIRYYEYAPSRAGAVAQRLLHGFTDVLSSDFYGGSSSLLVKRQAIWYTCSMNTPSSALAVRLAPQLPDLRLDHLQIATESISVTLTATAAVATCPLCGTPSTSVHSSYSRRPADLPWAAYTVRLHLTVRKFFCPLATCPRRIFTERLPYLVAPYARRTARLAQILSVVAAALGGNAGARLSGRLGIPVSAPTLLRLIRAAPEPPLKTPRVLGLDDFAFRKGRNYGTLLVDQERRRPIDLLPDRTADTLAAWLHTHPGVEVITRDRSTEYIRGATLGAPQARQIADRFHLVGNLREALERLLDRNRSKFGGIVLPRAGLTASVSPGVPPEAQRLPAPRTATEITVWQARRATKQAHYEQVRCRHAAGESIRSIAAHMKLSRGTVYRYLRSDSDPTATRIQSKPSMLDAFLPYLYARWQAGCDNGVQLWRELKQQGYPGSRKMVAAWVAQQRQTPAKTGARQYQTPEQRQRTMRARQEHQQRTPSSKRLSYFLLRDPQDLNLAEKAVLQQIQEVSADVATSYGLVQEFLQMVRKESDEPLEDWLRKVAASNVEDLQSFATGVERDKDAVMAGLTETWSNERAAYCTPSPRSSLPGRIHFRWRCPLAGQVSGRRNKQLLRSL